MNFRAGSMGTILIHLLFVCVKTSLLSKKSGNKLGRFAGGSTTAPSSTFSPGSGFTGISGSVALDVSTPSLINPFVVVLMKTSQKDKRTRTKREKGRNAKNDICRI